MRKHCLLFLLLIFAASAQAQDPQFSQFYASPLYMNPAFAGGAEQGRFGINFRNQWPNLPAAFVTYSAWADVYLKESNSGLGIWVMSDKVGEAGLTSTQIALQYAYQLQISKNWNLRMGAQGTYIRKHIDYSKLVFASQIDPQNGFDPNRPGPNLGGLNTNLFSGGLGTALYSAQAWIAASVNHINRPNESLTEEFSALPRKLNLQAGYRIPLTSGPRRYDLNYTFKEREIVPVFQYRSQYEFQSLDVGAYAYLEPMVFGLWYRGLPIAPGQRLPYNEALIVLVGLSHQNFSFGYSFDYTLSQLGVASGGAHEISLVFLFDHSDARKRRNNPRPLPLPKF